MKRASKKVREIRFHSGKCGRIICVNSYAEQEYAKRLEADDRVENYEENCCLDPERFQHVNPVGIRAAYMKQEWKTDFLIYHRDGTTGTARSISVRAGCMSIQTPGQTAGQTSAQNRETVLMESPATPSRIGWRSSLFPGGTPGDPRP